MHTHDLKMWQHSHNFLTVDRTNERNTAHVVILTGITMIVEIIAGILSGSMALLADGWHMGTHLAALGISLFAYRHARKYAQDRRYTFGTGKVGILGGFASAVALVCVAILMIIESIKRFMTPISIHFNQAIKVAVIGLLVNLVSAYLLRGGHSHHHHEDSEPSHHHDHNLRAAYLHVIADAMTSVLAIFALTAGKFAGLVWLDPMMGLVGSVLISKWAYTLICETGRILVDGAADQEVVNSIRSAIESEADNKVSDLHIWRVGSDQIAAIISLVTSDPQPAEHYRKLLSQFEDLVHVTVEVHLCCEKKDK